MSWKVGGGLTTAEREKLNKIDVGVKSNLNATAAPTVNDDTKKGYGVGSTWVYNSVTYLCTDASEGKAVWTTQDNIYYFDTWAALVAAISVTGSTYVGKYAIVANANNAPSSGITYTAPNALTDYIVDGGLATYKIIAQGASYSVTCQPRTVVNPIVTSVMLAPAAKPTVKGYYIFTVNPTDGLPAGIGLNDIAYYNGGWSMFQKYSSANTVLVANDAAGFTQVTWRKFAGTWMSTADEFIPDGLEYQTGKLWSGKPVYRKCMSGTTPNGTTVFAGITIPITGTVTLVLGTLKDSAGTVTTAGRCTEFGFYVDNSGKIGSYASGAFASRPCVVWAEYTKS